ncbi:MAG: hypothetical protein R2720_07025 [Candidatus Nanopelagicales bacterium]
MSTTLTPRPTDAATYVTPQRVGGLAALGQAGTFIIGMILFVTVIASANYGQLDGNVTEQIAFLADNQLVLQVWYGVIYLAFGGLLVVQALSLKDRLMPHVPSLAKAATAFALVWATLMFAVGMTAMIGSNAVVGLATADPALATSLWSTVQLLIEGMGGGIEIVGGLWVGLISIAALRSGQFPRALNYVGLAVGTAGVATVTIVANEVLTALFGVGIIAWYVWIGVVMLRRTPQLERV